VPAVAGVRFFFAPDWRFHNQIFVGENNIKGKVPGVPAVAGVKFFNTPTTPPQ